MRFLLSPEQRQFAATLHELLGGADTAAAARAWAAGEHDRGLKLWRALADLGVFALLVDEELGAGPVDLVVAFEALGYHAVPGPLVESAAVAPALRAFIERRSAPSHASALSASASVSASASIQSDIGGQRNEIGVRLECVAAADGARDIDQAGIRIEGPRRPDVPSAGAGSNAHSVRFIARFRIHHGAASLQIYARCPVDRDPGIC